MKKKKQKKKQTNKKKQKQNQTKTKQNKFPMRCDFNAIAMGLLPPPARQVLRLCLAALGLFPARIYF